MADKQIEWTDLSHGLETSKLLKEMTKEGGKVYPHKRPKWKLNYDTAVLWFSIINREVFDDALPKPDILEIRRRHGCWAEVECWLNEEEQAVFHLSLHNRFKSKKHFLKVLGHEMVHMMEYLTTGKMTHHGESFSKWIPVFAEHKLKLQIKPD